MASKISERLRAHIEEDERLAGLEGSAHNSKEAAMWRARRLTLAENTQAALDEQKNSVKRISEPATDFGLNILAREFFNPINPGDGKIETILVDLGPQNAQRFVTWVYDNTTGDKWWGHYFNDIELAVADWRGRMSVVEGERR